MARANLPNDDVKQPVIRAEKYPRNSNMGAGNSGAARSSTKVERARPEPVTKGKVIVRKKPIGRRIFETFVKEDVPNIKEYVIHDWIVPAIKNFFFDGVIGGISDTIEMSLFGTTRGARGGSRVVRSQGQSYVQYQSASQGRTGNTSIRTVNNRAAHNFGDIILETRGEAEEVLSQLVDYTTDDKTASVADLYYLVGMDHNFTDQQWGWFDLSGASVDRVREGYILRLPKPVLIN